MDNFFTALLPYGNQQVTGVGLTLCLMATVFDLMALLTATGNSTVTNKMQCKQLLGRASLQNSQQK